MIDTVIQAAQALLGLPGAAPTADVHFTDLGGDSLSALSFSNLLGELFGVEVPVGVIIGPAADLAALAGYVESERAIGWPAADRDAVCTAPAPRRSRRPI